MPGEVPPSVIESLTMVVARVVGNDDTVRFSQTRSILELNVMMRVVIAAALQSVQLQASVASNMTSQCVRGLEAAETGPHNRTTWPGASCSRLCSPRNRPRRVEGWE